MTRIVHAHTPTIDAVKRRDEAALDSQIASRSSAALDYTISVVKGRGLERVRDLAPRPLEPPL